MPFNDKGEFIRSGRPAKASRISGSSKAQMTPTEEIAPNSDDLLTITKGLAALALLAGLIWVVVVFHQWIAIALGLLAIRCVQSWLR